MSSRTNLPTSLSSGTPSSPTLKSSGEGVTFANRTPSVPAAANLPPTVGGSVRSLSGGNAMPAVAQPPTFVPLSASTPTPLPQSLSPPMPGTEGNMGEINMGEAKPGLGYNFDSASLVILILVPIVVYLCLFASKPHCCCDLLNGERVINTSKILLWVLVISIILWILIWLGMSYWNRGKVIPAMSLA